MIQVYKEVLHGNLAPAEAKSKKVSHPKFGIIYIEM